MYSTKSLSPTSFVSPDIDGIRERSHSSPVVGGDLDLVDLPRNEAGDLVRRLPVVGDVAKLESGVVAIHTPLHDVAEEGAVPTVVGRLLGRGV